MTNVSDDFNDGKGKQFDSTGSGSHDEVALSDNDHSFIESVRLRQDFDSKVTAKKAIVSVPVVKPDKKWFIRVNGKDDWQLEVALLEEGREQYIVSPAMHPEVADVAKPSLLYTAVTSTGNVFFWPVNLPKDGEGANTWTDSAKRAAARAKDHWIRISANWTFKNYDVFEAQGTIAPPVWPEMGFEALLKIAFANRSSTPEITLS
jgi:hypothetical protein